MKKIFISILIMLSAVAAISAQEVPSPYVSGEVAPVTDKQVTEYIIDYMKTPAEVKTDLPAVLDLWAPWCGPCRRLSPIIDELAKEYAGRVAFYKVNVDDNQKTAMAFHAQSIPMLVFIPADGKLGAIQGLQSKESLTKIIDEYLLGK